MVVVVVVGTMGVNSLPKPVTQQHRDCDLNPGPSAPESSMITTRLLRHLVNGCCGDSSTRVMKSKSGTVTSSACLENDNLWFALQRRTFLVGERRKQGGRGHYVAVRSKHTFTHCAGAV